MLVKKILVVDDELEILNLLGIELTTEGYEVQKARGGQAAITQALAWQPDLVLMDVLMPGMNGAETVKALKADDRTKDVPVIFLSAISMHEEGGQECQKINVDNHWYEAIAKPFEHAELLEAIHRTLKA